jgi:uracil-DNA glycosylase family 4
MTEVLPVGPEDAKIMLVGEAPGEKEVEKGMPFVGMAGKTLDGILEEVGLNREDVRITNVMRTRPPANKFTHFYHKVKNKVEPKPELLEGIDRLHQEIRKCNPNVIVPLGTEPMKAVLGYGGILNWRGSVLESNLGKVVPTIHPAAILREWSYRPAVVSDFRKIKEQSHDKEISTTDRYLEINPDFNRVCEAIEEARQAEEIAFDIETEKGEVSCVGISWESHKAICIPFWFGGREKEWKQGALWNEQEEEDIWSRLKFLLESETPRKIAHNGSYDVEFLRDARDIKSKLHFDTMLASHTLYPELPKALSYWVSILTDHPYYKYQLKTDSLEEFFRYNATDACVTFEIAQKLKRELDESELWGFYNDFVHSLVFPLLGMQKRGVGFDVERRKQLKKEYKQDVDELQKELEEQVGHELNIASHKQMTEWLYIEMGVPLIMKKRKTGVGESMAADEDALKKIRKKNNIPAIDTILEIREKKKVLSTYLGVKVDTDHRIRCSYNITGTETGRLSSSRNLRGTGTNLQNIPSGVVKELFVPSTGHVLINADLSQAEARIVAYLSRDRRLIEVFEQGGDIHRRNASNIFGKREDEISKEERQLAKAVVHASNYAVGPRTFANMVGIPMPQAKRLLNQYFATYPRIRTWHKDVEAKLRSVRTLYNPFGRRRIFFNRWNDSLVKEGLAFIPQSTVADIMNRAVVELHACGVELLLQVHDSVVVECKSDRVEDNVKALRRAMERELEIEGSSVRIPMDYAVGSNWEECK